MIRTALKSFALLALLAAPVASFAQDATGLWKTPMSKDGQLQIKIAKCGQALCGKIVGAMNPQGETGPYEHLGKLMIWDMVPQSKAGTWDDGKIWDPRNGRTFNSEMTLSNGKLKVYGCVLGICQGQTWVPAG